LKSNCVSGSDVDAELTHLVEDAVQVEDDCTNVCNTQSGRKQSWNSGSVDLNGPINLQAVYCNFAQLPLHVDCPVCAKQGLSCADVEAVHV